MERQIYGVIAAANSVNEHTGAMNRRARKGGIIRQMLSNKVIV